MTPQSEIQPMSEAGRLSNVFFEPKRAFADIAARPRPWAPLALTVLMALLFTTIFTNKVGWERYMRQKAETTPQLQKLDPDQRERAIQMQAKFAPIMGFVGAAVAPPVMALIIAAVVMLFARMMSATVTFKQMFSISAYSFVPGLLASLAAIAVMFLKNPDDFNLENPTVFNVGAFLDPLSTGKALMAVATSLDLFAIWSAILIAIGITAASPKTSFGKAFTAVAIPWCLWIVVKMGLAQLRG